MADDVKDSKYKATLNLPRTDFPIRPNAKVDDAVMINRWQQEQLYEKAFVHNAGHQKYILHDGPPYANGHIHIGHAYNKILKDIITKSQRMLGKHVPVTPGWDCHGLPIELKVSQENPALSRQDLKKACRSYAQKWIEVQKEEFKRLGVVMDWDNPYTTMSYSYESSILQAFGQFVDAGYIERKNKTVPWCASCQTVLATAEIEYQDRKDPSVYVLFELDASTVKKLFPVLEGKIVNFLIWTTTPWTLPLNRAVLLRPGVQYVVVDLNGTYVITAKQLVNTVAKLIEADPKVMAEFNSDELLARGARAHHPFIEGLLVPIILDQSVVVEDGTACVHSAPGCGPEDYEVGVRNNLEIYSPLSSDGKYTADIVPHELIGMSVIDGQIWVIKKLVEKNKLFHKASIRHSYPHCWRCHNGLMFRATKQWFCDLSKENLKDRALTAIDTVVTLPEKSANRLKATVEGRLEWCLSRQRVWGVPIPAVICKQCDYTHITSALITQVASGVAQEGIEYWDTVTLQELLPSGFICPGCNKTDFAKETDILDVWFDSGVSHFAVLKKNPALQYPADIYLEGKDQHRGWFQSSLLTAVVLEKSAPMRTIVTHGFTVDLQGRKMSKSIGNVVSPQEIIDQLGTDGLRLWASSIDCSGDAVVSDLLLNNVSQVFRKIRNTCRFLLSNIYDFDITTDAIPFDKMLLIDQYAVSQLELVNREIIQAYDDLQPTAIFHALADYAAVDLSSFYLDIVKDRLYVEKSDGFLRRSAQTACWYILDTLTRLIAPILSCTAEQIADLYQKNKIDSIHLQNFATIESDITVNKQEWLQLKSMRGALLKAIETLRSQGIIKHSLEADLTIYLDENVKQSIASIITALEKTNQSQEDFFKECMIVSACAFAAAQGDCQKTELPGLHVRVQKATGEKCPRCWHWQNSVHVDGLCKRCQAIV